MAFFDVFSSWFKTFILPMFIFIILHTFMVGTNPCVHVCSGDPVSPSVVTIIWLWTLNLKASLGVAPKRNYDVSVHFTSSMPLTTFLVLLGAVLLWHNGPKVFMKSHFNFYKFAISRKTFKCFYFCYSRKFLVKS